MSKQRTITLTKRRPVTIGEDEWPIVARAADDDCTIADPARRNQAIDQGQVNEWWVRVRQHADGRSIAYGGYDEGEWAHSEREGPTRAGEIIDDPDDLIAAIERVGETLGLPERTIAECIASLPAEKL